MADVFGPDERSRVMRAVLGSRTKPEIVVQAIVRELGRRPRLNDVTLPGRPDLVFSRLKKVIFVHGCFWHRHHCDAGRSTPASNVEYWLAKFARNRRRDRKVKTMLRAAGWQVLTIWECQTAASRISRTAQRIRRFLAQ